MDTTDKVEAFQTAIGKFVLAWADLEQFLDLLVLTLRLKQEPAKQEKKLEHSLTPKIGYAKKKLNLVADAPLRVRIGKVIDEIEALQHTRHDYVHGAVIGRRIGRSQMTATMGRLLQPPKAERRLPITVTTRKVNSTANRVTKLADRLLDLLAKL
jgi:hypothetical protein